MHSAAEHLWELANAGAEQMAMQQARADQILATFAAGVNTAAQRDAQLRAVVAIASEVERHAGAIDPREVTATSVAFDLIVELAQGMRHMANVMIRDDRPATNTDGPKWPASLMDDEVKS